MPRKQIRPTHTELSAEGEAEVLDAYAEFLDSSGSPDLLLRQIPALLDYMHVQRCFTSDITSCIAWFYDTRRVEATQSGPRWAVAEQLLRHLTLSVSVDEKLEISEIIDVDKLLRFMGRLLSMRDNYDHILGSWALFVDASQGPGQDYVQCVLDLQDLQKIKRVLALDDLGDALLIDMVSCSSGLADGSIFNYSLARSSVHVTFKDFAEILGRIGEF